MVTSSAVLCTPPPQKKKIVLSESAYKYDVRRNQYRSSIAAHTYILLVCFGFYPIVLLLTRKYEMRESHGGNVIVLARCEIKTRDFGKLR